MLSRRAWLAWAQKPAPRFAVFRSSDGGQNWSASGAGLPPEARVNALASTGGTAMAATDAGVFVSTNGGRNWSAGRSGRALSVAGERRLAVVGWERAGIGRSEDGGLSWQPNDGLGARTVRSLIAHASRFYAGTDAEGVWASVDGGMKWQPIGEGLPPGAQLFALAAAEGRVFAALYSKGLYTRAAGEPRWTRLGPVQPLGLAEAGGVLVAGHNPGGIFRSADGGASWSPAMIEGMDAKSRAAVWVMGSGGRVLLAGVETGVYRSTDEGRTWQRCRGGLPAQSSGVAFGEVQGELLAAVLIS